MLDTRWQNSEVLVKFRTGLQLWVPAPRVMFTAGPEEPLDSLQARRMTEAFRLGIVPLQDVEDFFFGRESEARKVEQGLEGLVQGRGDVLLVEGDYGSGKTHLLEYVHHRALNMGFAATRVEFDPHDVAPNRPKRVYRELVHSLRWIDGADGARTEYGFRDLLWRARSLAVDDHVFFGPVLNRLRRMKEHQPMSEVFWQMIEGESSKEYAVQYRSPYRVRGGHSIPALYDFSTAGDFYCYIISGLSHMCRELGLKGLVLLIDEAETVTHLWDILAFARGMNFIEGLIRTSLNDPELKKIDDKLIHNRVRTTPYIYREAQIYLVIATTPQPYDYTYLKMTNYIRNRLVLQPLRDQALLDAFHRLVAIYQQAHSGFTLPELEKKRMLEHALKRRNEGLRYFLKFCVEAMDLTRINRRAVDYRRA